MIPGLAFLLVANAATLLGARTILDGVRTGKPSTDFTLFLLIRLLLISAAVLIAGVARALTPVGIGAAGALALAFLVRGGAHRRWLQGFRIPWASVTSLLAGILLLRLLVQVWLFAPSYDDALSYHLPKIAEWVRAGGMTSERGSDPRATFPSGFELIETWWVVFLHHDVLIEMAGLEFLLLSAVALHAIALGLGWSNRSARIAALIFVMGPGLHFQSTSCLNDGAVAALLTASLALVVSGVSLPLLLLPLLLGIGVKPTVLLALPGLAVAAALLSNRDDRDLAPVSRTALLLAATAGCVGAFWYARNGVLFGNPIHPMGSGGMKSPLTGATLQRVGPSLQSLLENLRAFVDLRIYDAQAPADGNCTLGFNGGAAVFALGFPALVVVLRNEPLLRRLALGVAVSVASVFTCVVLDPWNNRFVLFLTAIPALGLARLWDRSRLVAGLGAVALSIQFFATFVPGNLPPRKLAALARQSWSERAAMPLTGAAPSQPVGFCCDDFGPAYPLYGPDYSRRVVYARDETADDLLAHLDREGVRLLVVSGPLPKRTGMIQEALRRGRLKPVPRGGWSCFEVLPGR